MKVESVCFFSRGNNEGIRKRIAIKSEGFPREFSSQVLSDVFQPSALVLRTSNRGGCWPSVLDVPRKSSEFFVDPKDVRVEGVRQ